MQKMHTHTRTHAHTLWHTHTVQTDRSERQCGLTEIFWEEKCLELAFDCISYFQIHLTITVANDYIIYADNFNKLNKYAWILMSSLLHWLIKDQIRPHKVGTSCIVNEPTVYAVLVSILGLIIIIIIMIDFI